MPRLLRPLFLTGLLASLGAASWGQQGIYTCVDAKGRRLTSDRPIAECNDREQKELNPTGTVRRTVPPTLTAAERAEREEQEKKAAEERQRLADEKRQQRALLARYPRQALHDAERANALKQVEDTIAAGQRRLAELQQQRARMLQEGEFFKAREAWPLKLKRQFEDNEQQIAAQKRMIAGQDEERARISARFDDELARLKLLWAQATPAASTAASASQPVKR